MPRKGTFKKGNTIKYRKQTRRVRKKRYDNLPKRTRKQRAGAREAGAALLRGVKASPGAAKTAIKASPGALGSALSYLAPKFVNKGAEKIGKSEIVQGASSMLANAGSAVGQGVVSGVESAYYKAKRNCSGKEKNVHFDLVGDNDSKIICGKSYFENTDPDPKINMTNSLSNIKTEYKKENGGELIINKDEKFKKVGLNTVRFSATGKSGDASPEKLIVVLSPVKTDSTSLSNRKMSFKKGTKNREINNLRNFFFYNLLAPYAFLHIDKESLKQKVTEKLNLLTPEKTETPMNPEIIDFFLKRINDNAVYLELKEAPETQSGGMFRKSAAAIKRLNPSKPNYRIDFNNRSKPDKFEMRVISNDVKANIKDYPPHLKDKLLTDIMYTYNQSEESKALGKGNDDDEEISSETEKFILKMIGDLSNEVDKDKQTSRSDPEIQKYLSAILSNGIIKDSNKEKLRTPNTLCSNFGLGNDLADSTKANPDSYDYLKYLHVPIISGIDNYTSKIDSGKSYLPGTKKKKENIQKRYFAIFKDDRESSEEIEKRVINNLNGEKLEDRIQRESEEITEKERAEVYSAFSKIGVYINTNNLGNFIRIKEGNETTVKILSLADAEIHKPNFLSHLKRLKDKRNSVSNILKTKDDGVGEVVGNPLFSNSTGSGEQPSKTGSNDPQTGNNGSPTKLSTAPNVLRDNFKNLPSDGSSPYNNFSSPENTVEEPNPNPPEKKKKRKKKKRPPPLKKLSNSDNLGNPPTVNPVKPAGTDLPPPPGEALVVSGSESNNSSGKSLYREDGSTNSLRGKSTPLPSPVASSPENAAAALMYT